MIKKPINKKEVSLRVNLGTKPIFGHGKAKLLEAIDKYGSISAAARNINMSYRRAWLLTDSMNKNFILPLIESSLGGKGGGGRPDFAQAGGILEDKIDESFNKIKSLI